MPDIAASWIQSFQALLCFFIATRSGDENPRRLAATLQMHLAHADQSDAGVAQLSFDESPQFLAQRLLQALTMMFLSPVFHSSRFITEITELSVRTIIPCVLCFRGEFL